MPPTLGQRVVGRLRRMTGARAPTQPGVDWERRWRDPTEGSGWREDAIRPELVDLLDRIELPIGAALDVGSGEGLTTCYLAGRFGRAVGLELAPTAVALSQEHAARQGVEPRFVVAAAPELPIGDGKVAFLFDRGCLHLLPERDRRRYWREMERVLVAGGWAQLIEHEHTVAAAAKELPAGLRVVETGHIDQQLEDRVAPMTVLVLRRS